jgi:hypothetical protein
MTIPVFPLAIQPKYAEKVRHVETETTPGRLCKTSGRYYRVFPAQSSEHSLPHTKQQSTARQPFL